MTSIPIRHRLEEIADEHERLLAENRAITLENVQLKQQVAEGVTGTIIDLDHGLDAKAVNIEFSQSKREINSTMVPVNSSTMVPVNSDGELSSVWRINSITTFQDDPDDQISDPLPPDVPDEYTLVGGDVECELYGSEDRFAAKHPQIQAQVEGDDSGSEASAPEDAGPSSYGSSGTNPRRSCKSSTNTAVLSRWFNPDTEESFADYNSIGRDPYMSQRVSEDKSQTDCCILPPLSAFRLSWDSLAFLCILWELWMTPFEVVFLYEAGTPAGFNVVSLCITGFFTVDIFLNFVTGYIEGDKTIMQRKLIVKNYMKFWLWIDLLATVPFDRIVETVTSEFLSMARVGKASRGIKALRYLKLVRAVRLLKSMEQAGRASKHLAVLAPLRVLMTPAQVLVALIVLAHVHGCIWAAFQPDWIAVLTSRAALRCYYESFSWAFMAFGAGVFDDASVRDPWIWTLEMCMASERLALIVFGGLRVCRHSLAFYEEARRNSQQKSLLSYFRHHSISLKTQIQAMFSLTDVGSAKKRQQDSDLLTELPHELGFIVRTELWSDRLRSLGLISEISLWNFNFTSELAQLVSERVLPSKCLVLDYGTAAVATYYILDGELQVTQCSCKVPNFKAGMWVGENALVSSVLRYSATMYTRMMSSLMVLKGEEFRQLISNLALMPRFEQFCSEELWQGLCGRCGTLGDHFSDSCPEVFDSRSSKVQQDERQLASRHSVSPLNLELMANSKSDDEAKRLRHARSASLASYESESSQQSIEYAGSEGSLDSGQSMRMRSTMSRMSLQSLSPVQGIQSLVKKMTSKPSRSAVRPTLSERPSSPSRALKRLLRDSGLLKLESILNGMGVHDLDDLERLDMGAFASMLEASGTVEVSSRDFDMLTPQNIRRFKELNKARVHASLFGAVSRLHHLIFLSHYKVEAGTEAALMRTELEHAIQGNSNHPGNHFDQPVFLDSDNLTALSDLQEKVRTAHNLVLLLTRNVLRRRWVLLEILTARREGTRIILVQISKPGYEFVFPDESFFEMLQSGKFLDQSSLDLITECNFTVDDLEQALRTVFQNIARPYSPHKSSHIRRAEISALLDQCRLRQEAITNS